ncbi:MAG: ClpXP protease specificity-enhancing factor SspB, partial [Pseudolabrys sp.]
IILQHQFWDLAVEEDRFSITLSFGGRHERLTIPFSALTAFADPSVKFGLQFEANEDELQAKTPALKATKQIESPIAPASSEERKGADVVALDTFRKK